MKKPKDISVQQNEIIQEKQQIKSNIKPYPKD
ncbi:hypothetical protein ABID53_003885 [Bacillus oleivorans]